MATRTAAGLENAGNRSRSAGAGCRPPCRDAAARAPDHAGAEPAAAGRADRGHLPAGAQIRDGPQPPRRGLLWRVAKGLGVEVDYFFAGLGGKPGAFKPAGGSACCSKLTRSFLTIPDPRRQAALCDLARALASLERTGEAQHATTAAVVPADPPARRCRWGAAIQGLTSPLLGNPRFAALICRNYVAVPGPRGLGNHRATTRVKSGSARSASDVAEPGEPATVGRPRQPSQGRLEQDVRREVPALLQPSNPELPAQRAMSTSWKRHHGHHRNRTSYCVSRTSRTRLAALELDRRRTEPPCHPVQVGPQADRRVAAVHRCSTNAPSGIDSGAAENEEAVIRQA